MNNVDQNKKAIMDLFSMEDAVGLCESFGQNMSVSNTQDVDDFAPVSMDGMFSVNTNDAPTEGPGFLQMEDDTKDPDAQRAMTEIFVSELSKKDPNMDVKLADEVPSISTVIRGYGFKGDIEGFIKQISDCAIDALSGMNVTDKNPYGAANVEMHDDTVGAGAPERDSTAGAGMAPAMEPLPSTVPDASLDLNTQSEVPDMDLSSLDGLDLGGDSSLGGDDLSLPSEAPAEEPVGDADFLGGAGASLDSLSDDDFVTEDPAAEESAPVEEPASEEPAPVEDSEPSTEEAPADEESKDDEGLFESVAAKLESVRSNYMDRKMNESIDAIFESCRAEDAKKAKLDAIIESYVADDSRQKKLDAIVESVVAECGDGCKGAGCADAKPVVEETEAAEEVVTEEPVVEGIEDIPDDGIIPSDETAAPAEEDDIGAIYESIVANYERQTAIAAEKERTKAALESIISNYTAGEQRKAKLEAIVQNYHASVAAAEAPKATLESQLDAIAAKTKSMMA